MIIINTTYNKVDFTLLNYSLTNLLKGGDELLGQSVLDLILAVRSAVVAAKTEYASMKGRLEGERTINEFYR